MLWWDNITLCKVKKLILSYGSEEIRDVVLYFADQAETYGVDPSKFTLMGYSAGAYYDADSTRLLQKADFDMSSLVLCYPWTTGLDADKLENDFPPTLFILSGQDPISQKAKNYVKDMESAGLEVEVIEYENAVHSFIESNNPEGMVEGSADMADVINPEQEALVREAEAAISEWIRLAWWDEIALICYSSLYSSIHVREMIEKPVMDLWLLSDYGIPRLTLP